MVYTWHLSARILGFDPLGRAGLGTLVFESTAAQTVGSMHVYYSAQRFGAFEPWRRMVLIPVTVSQVLVTHAIHRGGVQLDAFGLQSMRMEVFHSILFRLCGFEWYCVVWGQSMDMSHLNAYVHHPDYPEDVWDRYEAFVGTGRFAEQVPGRYREVQPRYINYAETLRMEGWEQPRPQAFSRL